MLQHLDRMVPFVGLCLCGTRARANMKTSRVCTYTSVQTSIPNSITTKCHGATKAENRNVSDMTLASKSHII